MTITNEMYTACPKCGLEANGLDEINKIFGYYIKDEEMKPYKYCRSCRKWMGLGSDGKIHSGRENRANRWANAASWADEINLSSIEFNVYLEQLGYLAAKKDGGRERTWELTELGKKHSATPNDPADSTILWDKETFDEIIHMRAKKTKVRFYCPECGKRLDEAPDFVYLQGHFICAACGFAGTHCAIDTTFAGD